MLLLVQKADAWLKQSMSCWSVYSFDFSRGKLHSRWSARAIFPTKSRTSQQTKKTCFTTKHGVGNREQWSGWCMGHWAYGFIIEQRELYLNCVSWSIDILMELTKQHVWFPKTNLYDPLGKDYSTNLTHPRYALSRYHYFPYVLQWIKLIQIKAGPRHQSQIHRCYWKEVICQTLIDGILPKGPYPPCLPMADRALSAVYPRFMETSSPFNQFLLPESSSSSGVSCLVYFINHNKGNVVHFDKQH